jgi:5S rRNA maturation endonuclease (ribonuclease M5)
VKPAQALLTEIDAEGEALDTKIQQLLAIMADMRADREELEEAARRASIAGAARCALVVEAAMFFREQNHGPMRAPRGVVLQ